MAGEFHYPIGGSTVELAELCAASVKQRKLAGGGSAGPKAEIGRRIHKYIELTWASAFGSYQMKPEDREFIKLLPKDEMAIGAAMVEGLKLICTKYGMALERATIEEQFSFIGDFAGGTPDWFNFRVGGDFVMLDFKTGYEQIYPDENLQELFYTCAVLRHLPPLIARNFERFHLIIFQPHPETKDLQVRTWTTTPALITEYDGRFAATVADVQANPDRFTPGDHCDDMWCPVRATCQAKINWVNERTEGRLMQLLTVGKVEQSGGLGAPRGLRLAQALDGHALLRKHAKAMIEHCDAEEAEAKLLLRDVPDAIPGYKLEPTISKRIWVDPKATEKYAKQLGLKAADYKEPAALLDPVPFEKLLKSKELPTDISALVHRPETGVKLVKGDAVSVAEKFLAALV